MCVTGTQEVDSSLQSSLVPPPPAKVRHLDPTMEVFDAVQKPLLKLADAPVRTSSLPCPPSSDSTEGPYLYTTHSSLSPSFHLSTFLCRTQNSITAPVDYDADSWTPAHTHTHIHARTHTHTQEKLLLPGKGKLPATVLSALVKLFGQAKKIEPSSYAAPQGLDTLLTDGFDQEQIWGACVRLS